MIRLLDVNILVALLWTRHKHHVQARSWFSANRESGWATCAMTQLGCARILALPSTSLGEFDVASATSLVERLIADTRHSFWVSDIQVTHPLFADSLPHIQGHNQLTDRYLLALAAAHDGVLATFDRSLGSGLPADSPLLQHLDVIPA